MAMFVQVLVINCGSSSVKYKLLDKSAEQVLLEGVIEDPETVQSHHRWTIYRDGVATVRDESLILGSLNLACELIYQTLTSAELIDNIAVVSHRVVHGGDRYHQPVQISAEVLTGLKALERLAPLHQQKAVSVIEHFLSVFHDVPQVAVFDTTFHQTLPEVAYRYAVPASWYENYGVKRYGFHGSSHQYVADEAARLLGRPLEKLNLISLHLGNGASICAIQGGRSIDTSMGFTPMEGLVMGTRSGDIDAEILFYLQQTIGLSVEQIRHQFEHEAGLTGLAGTHDIRQLLQREQAGDTAASLALSSYVYRIRKYIGAYFAVLEQVDAIIFTAGVGENATEIRRRCCENMSVFGLQLDVQRNAQADRSARVISVEHATPAILVIPTNEEKQIAWLSLAVLQ